MMLHCGDAQGKSAAEILRLYAVTTIVKWDGVIKDEKE